LAWSASCPFSAIGFAVAENHRWHHRKSHLDSQVNFGGYFAFWDHLFGTAYHQHDPVDPDGVGIAEEPAFPKGYLAQLAYPFKG
jgi:sterol desaturase/sphingolipid hydroxylase (fatty acid hydroxylase superfamily)